MSKANREKLVCFPYFRQAIEVQPRRFPRKPQELGGIIPMHRIVLLTALLFAFCAATARGNPAQDQDKDQLPANYVPSGGQIFKQYCACMSRNRCEGATAL